MVSWSLSTWSCSHDLACCVFPHAPPRQVKYVAERQHSLLDATTHTLDKAGKLWICLACRQTCKTAHLARWLARGPCPLSVDAPGFPQAAHDAQPHNADQAMALRLLSRAHPSHRCEAKAGLVLCTHCGAWGSQKRVNFAGLCPDEPTQIGLSLVRRWKSGLHPTRNQLLAPT